MNKTWKLEDDPGYPCRDCAQNHEDCPKMKMCARYRAWFSGKSGMWARVRKPIIEYVERMKKNEYL